MTFNAFETSTEQSRPIEVYKFDLGSSVFLYTSAEDEVVVDSETYVPESIIRGKVVQGPEDRKALLEVTVPASNEFARLYASIVPGQRALLTVKRIQRPDYPSPGVFAMFQGYVTSVAFVSQGKEAKIAAMPIIGAASRSIPRFTYQSLCNHVLYDPNGCKLNRNDFKFSGGITAVSSNQVTVPGADGFPDGYFNTGYIETMGGLDVRLILHHVGTTLTLLLPFPFSAVGAAADLFAGCLHDAQTCDAKFGNILNYGGFPFVPHVNPFRSGIG